MTICRLLFKILLTSLYEYLEVIRNIRAQREQVFLEIQMHIFNIGSPEQVLGKGTYNMKHGTNSSINIQFLRVHYYRDFIPVS